jgi:hypothetical protein
MIKKLNIRIKQDINFKLRWDRKTELEQIYSVLNKLLIKLDEVIDKVNELDRRNKG